MDTPRSKFVSNNMAKVRPKLPLYSKKTSEKISQSKSVTMNDILKSVKTLDDTGSVKKIERPVAFSRGDSNLKKFQPCSSLDNINNTNPGFRESCVSGEFSEWESETNDPKTPSKSDISNDESPRSPILLSKVSFQGKSWKTNAKPVSSSPENKLCDSQSVVNFKSLLGTQPVLPSSLENHKPEENQIRNASGNDHCGGVDHYSVSNDGIVGKVRTEQGLDSIPNDPKIVIAKVDGEGDQNPRLVPIEDQPFMESQRESVLPYCVNSEKGGASVEPCNPSPASYSQGSFENEANAALSVFDVSDFLTCSKTGTTREHSLSQFGSVKDSSKFCVPPTPQFTGHIVGKSTHEENGSVDLDSCEVQPSFTEEICQEVPATDTVSTGFTKACGRNVRVAEKNLNSASQLLDGVDHDDMTASSQFKHAAPGVSSSNNSECIKQSQYKKSLFTSASGKTLGISSENLRKAALLFEACNDDSPETSKVGNIAQLNRLTKNVDCGEPSTNGIPDSLEVQPASIESFSQDGPGNLELNPDTGFCTAKGKYVHVSEKSLSFASSLLVTLENESKPGKSSYEPTSSTVQTTISRPNFSDHHQYKESLSSTASEKTMTLSSANLLKAKPILDKCSDVHTEVSEPGPSRTKLDNSLASVVIEKKVLDCNSFEQSTSAHNAPKILPPVSEKSALKNTVPHISQIGGTTGFSTAGGKNVCVSKKSLNFASQLLESLETGENYVPISQKSNEPHVSRTTNTKSDHYRKSMFLSASGKVTSISSANLRKAKNLLDSLDGNSTEGNNSASELHKISLSGEVENDSKSGVEFSDLCTPENATLLDNDDELFHTIETPLKSRNPPEGCSSSTSRDSQVPQDNGFVNSCLEQNDELLSQTVSSKGGLEVDPHSSPTVFNESGLTTQRKNCGNGRDDTVIPRLLPKGIQTTPDSKASTPGQRSPVLLDGSFMGTPSPRRLQYQREQKESGKDKNISTATSCLVDEKFPSASPSSVQNCKAHTETGHKRSTRNVKIDEPGHNSNNSQTGFMFFKSSSGKPIEPSVASLNKVRALLSDLIDEEMDTQISSYVEHNDVLVPPKGKSVSTQSANGFSTESSKERRGSIECNIVLSDELRTALCKLEEIKRSPKKLNDAPEIKGTIFKSAAGKSIEVSDESLNRVKALFSDVLDEEVNEKREDGGGDMQTVEEVNADDLTKELSGEFCSPVLLDGSFVEKSGNAHSNADIDENKLVYDDRSHSPVLNCSFVAPEKQQSSIENSSSKLVATQVNSTAASLKEKVLSSPDWGEFPDLKSSQAALLENQAGTFTYDRTPKEDTGLGANQQNKIVEWGEFPEMPNVEVCKLEQTKNHSADAQPNEAPVVLKKSVLVESRLGLVNQKTTAEQSVINSPVTIERVPTQKQTDALQDSENSRKRKSKPNTLQSASKKSRPSLSPRGSEGSPNKLAIRKRIREQQCVIVRSKRHQRIQPSPGKLFITKKASCRWQLKDLDDELKMLDGNHVEVGVSKMVIDITSENSADYRFHFSNARAKEMNFVEGDLIADSCLVAYADDNTAGLKEVTTAFLTSPHVDPKLIPNDWIRNHYRWIVWKLACLERTFPQQFGGRCLTLENVLLQLKYRYDREIDMVQRSSFKKLLEGDAAPNKFICCVAAVKKNNLDEGESLLELELADGWYSIWAVIDSEMVDLVKRDVVGIGTKLIVHSAELTNCEQGCDPLNVPSNVKLKISTNSVRRVKWFAKMGFTSNNNPIPALLCSVLPNGGLIGQVTAAVARKYPVIYMCKDGDGKTVFKNERSQALFREQQEKIKSDRAEQVYEQVWKEVESKYRKTGKNSSKFTSKEIQNITDPELLFSIMDGSDAEFIQSQLSADQLRLVMNYKDEIMTKMKNDVQKVLQDKLSESEPITKVTKLLKVRLMDIFTEKHALLTIWRPSEDDLSALHEGKAFEFLNLIASGTRDKVLQLSSTRFTTYSFNEMLEPSEDCGRVMTPLRAVNTPGFTPTFGEIDVVGVVVLVKLPEQSRGVTVVYLSDLEGHYLSITFWTSLSVFGCEDLLAEGSVISCSNLQWRSVSNQRKIPSVFASEITSFSLNPKESHLHQGVAELKTKLADKEVGELVSSARSFILQTTGFRDVGSSPAPSTPLSSGRGTPALKKLRLMSRLGEDAPPLSPIPLTVTTRHVFQNFKSPCRTPLGPGKPKQS